MSAPGRVLTHKSTKWGRLAGTVTLAISALLAGLVVGQPQALAAGNLSSVLLTTTFPGLVLTAPGPENGPITPSDIGQATGMSGSAAAQFSQELSNGAVSAYERVWVRQPLNGDAVEISAFDFSDQGATAAFLSSMNASVANQSGAVTFAIPGIAGSSGYKVQATTAAGPTAEYLVTFARGGTVFAVAVLSSSGDLTSSDAVALATRQAANATGIPPASCPCVYQTTNWWRVSSLVVGLLLIAAVVIIGRKRKYPTALSGHLSAPLPMGPEGGGWATNGNNWNEERPKVGANRWP
jgi:hypothetical protein